MNQRPVLILPGALALLFACGGSGSDATTNTVLEKPTDDIPGPATKLLSGETLPADSRAFAEIAPFVKMAPSHGDRAQGTHGTFGVFPAGASSPPHTHSGAYHGVVLRGAIENPFGNEASPPTLGPGSYWHVPARAEHITRCVSDEPCEFYFHADSKFDFAPLKAMTTKRGDNAVSLQASALSWTEIAPFVKMAAAYGDRSSGGHGTFGRFPPGASSPVHTHSGDYRAVVLAGVKTAPFNHDPSPRKLGAGSGWWVPGGAVHATACVSDTPCLFYFHADSGFDFSPVGK